MYQKFCFKVIKVGIIPQVKLLTYTCILTPQVVKFSSLSLHVSINVALWPPQMHQFKLRTTITMVNSTIIITIVDQLSYYYPSLLHIRYVILYCIFYYLTDIDDCNFANKTIIQMKQNACTHIPVVIAIKYKNTPGRCVITFQLVFTKIYIFDTASLQGIHMQTCMSAYFFQL